MSLDLINTCLLDATQVLLMALTGVLVTASFLAFREAPVAVPTTSRKPK